MIFKEEGIIKEEKEHKYIPDPHAKKVDMGIDRYWSKKITRMLSRFILLIGIPIGAGGGMFGELSKGSKAQRLQ